MGAFECVGVNKISPTESTEVFTISMSSNSTLNETRKDIEAQSTEPTPRKHSIWWTLAVNLPLLAIYWTLFGLFEKAVITPHKGGFYCNDPALNHKSTGEVVTSEILIAATLILPILFILPTELIYVQPDFGQSRLRQVLKSSFYLLRTYCYGLMLSLGVVQVMKGLMGSPRPIFFHVCQPDTALTCNGSEFVSDFTCTSNEFSWWDQMDSYRSFPSGHSSTSVYTGLFLGWYLQRRAFSWSNRSTLLVPILQLLCLIYASVCALTRITDHRHHWWDVLAGFGIGVASFGYAVAITKNFTNYYIENDSVQSSCKSEESQGTIRTLCYEERRRDTVP